MRQIKFRGRRKNNGEWVYGYYFEINKCGFIIWKHATIHCIDSISDIVLDNHHDFVEVDPATVGQFTGLLDKNDKEIYEDDICKYINNTGNEQIGKVGWYAGEICCAAKTVGSMVNCYYASIKKGIEVIGNIHDNPELLKSESGK